MLWDTIARTTRGLALLGGAAGTLMAQGGSWPAFRGNLQRTGFVSDRLGVPSDKPLWTAKLGGPVVSSPVVSDGTLYIGCRDSLLYALDAVTGKVRWHLRTFGWIDASPLVVGDTVVVGSRDGRTYLFSVGRRDTVGTLLGGTQLSSAGVSRQGHLLVGLGPPYNRFSAFDTQSREPAWSLFFTQMCYSSPAVFGSYAVVGANDGFLYGANTQSGRLLWKIPTEGFFYVSTPAIVDSVVYFAPGGNDRSVHAVDLVTGRSLFRTGVGPMGKRAADDRERQLAGAHLSRLRRMSPAQRERALSAMDALGIGRASLAKRAAAGATRFLSDGGWVRTSSVAIGAKNVFVVQKELGYLDDADLTPAAKFSLLAFDQFDGKAAWAHTEVLSRDNPDGPGYCSSPAVAGDVVFTGWGGGKVYAIQASGGKVLWEERLSGPIISSPAVADGRLYVATMDGYLHAWDLTGTPTARNFKDGTYCYPNPSRGEASHIQVFVTKAAELDMVLYNIAEKPVWRVNSKLAANQKFTHDWKLANVANGVYFAVVKVKYAAGGSESKTLKVAVLR